MDAGFVFISGVEEGPDGELVFTRSEMIAGRDGAILLREVEPAVISMSISEEVLDRAIDAGYQRLGCDIESGGYEPDCCQEDDDDTAGEIATMLGQMLGIDPDKVIMNCTTTGRHSCQTSTRYVEPDGHHALNHAEIEVSRNGRTWTAATLVWIEEREEDEKCERVYVAVPEGASQVDFYSYARVAA